MGPVAPRRAGCGGRAARLTAMTRCAPRERSRRFVDELSNWYVRRNRRRFWKGELDADKRAAYATLYEVLTTLSRLMAPIIPHLADAMWDNLVAARRSSRARQRPPHRLPVADPRARPIRPSTSAVALARRTVALGRAARSASALRTRQPLRTVRVKLPAIADARSRASADVGDELRPAEVLDELNVQRARAHPR